MIEIALLQPMRAADVDTVMLVMIGAWIVLQNTELLIWGGVLMVEQNASAALDMCDHAYLLESGSLMLEGSGRDLMGNPHIREAYLAG